MENRTRKRLRAGLTALYALLGYAAIHNTLDGSVRHLHVVLFVWIMFDWPELYRRYVRLSVIWRP